MNIGFGSVDGNSIFEIAAQYEKKKTQRDGKKYRNY
jgi:hypothetical protein